MIPKFHLLYFKNLLDIAFIKFFEVYGQRFTKVGNDYVLLDSLSRQQIEKFFVEVILQELKEIVQPYDVIKSPNWYLIIGGCNPKDNLLLKFKDEQKYFPTKLNRILSGSIQVKYFLKEQGIKIDIVKFNQVCLDIFNQFFQSDLVQKKLGKDYSNVIFMTNKSLDCYSMFKVLKYIFGKANCVNVFLEKFTQIRPPIVAVNDLIDKYIANKSAMNSDRKFKTIVKEIQQFIELKIGFKR